MSEYHPLFFNLRLLVGSAAACRQACMLKHSTMEPRPLDGWPGRPANSTNRGIAASTRPEKKKKRSSCLALHQIPELTSERASIAPGLSLLACLRSILCRLHLSSCLCHCSHWTHTYTHLSLLPARALVHIASTSTTRRRRRREKQEGRQASNGGDEWAVIALPPPLGKRCRTGAGGGDGD